MHPPPAPLVYCVVMLGGVVLGMILRSITWHWYIRCPRRFSFWLALLLEEWERRTGYTHVHIKAGESALQLGHLSGMLRRYAKGEEPNRLEAS